MDASNHEEAIFHNLNTDAVNVDTPMEGSNTFGNVDIIPTLVGTEDIAECSSFYDSNGIVLAPQETDDLLEYNSIFGNTEIMSPLETEEVIEYNSYENTEITSTPLETEGIIQEYNNNYENSEIMSIPLETEGIVEYSINYEDTEITASSMGMDDTVGCISHTCESSEIFPTPVGTEDVIEYIINYENTEITSTSMGIEVRECKSTCGDAEIIPASIVEHHTEPELCFQPLPHSLHNPDLADMKSDDNTSLVVTSDQLALQSEEMFNALAARNRFEMNRLGDSDSLLNLPRLNDAIVGLILPENISQSVDTRSSNSPTTEKMDSTISSNLETQRACLNSISDKEIAVNGDKSLSFHEVEKRPNNLANGASSEIAEHGADESCLDVDVKQELYDSEYERSNLIYRSGTIQVDSDDDTSSTMFSKNSGDASDGGNDVSDVEVVERLNAREIAMSKNGSRTEGEIFPEELPPIEYLVISPGEDVVVEPVGTVSGIVGVLVIVKGDQNSPALYDDTVLFLQGRQPLGLIFEIFGTVEQPYYSVRFNSNKDIRDKDITAGERVFYAPRADNLTKYVFISELKKIKCDDASWEHDNEPPPTHVEFSDDEQERVARQRIRNKDRGSAENHGDFVHKKKRRRKRHLENGNGTAISGASNPPGLQLLQGDLNKNPFGSRDHKFDSSATTRKPHSANPGPVGNGHSFSGHRPHFSPRSSPQPPPFGGFRKPWPPRAGFGERPDWNCQPGTIGGIPNAPRMGAHHMGSFGNRNTFNSHQFQPFPPFNRMQYPSPSSSPSHSSCLPQNSMPSHVTRFGGGPYVTRPNSQSLNISLPPPLSPVPGLQIPPPHYFQAFNPSCPPPVVNSVFNIPPPQHPSL